MITKIILTIIIIGIISDVILCLRNYKNRCVKNSLIIKAIIAQGVVAAILFFRESISDSFIGWSIILYIIAYLAQIIYILITLFSKKREVKIAAISFASAILLFGLYGTTLGRLTIRKEYITIENNRTNSLVEGLKVVQVSDLHLGTLRDKSNFISRLVESINTENPDIVAITGDLVNKSGDEITPFIDDLSKIKAKIGVYVVLGNHDYGDYDKSLSREEKKETLDRLIANYKSMGWRFLSNENEKININGNDINIIGVEHLGGGKIYGDLNLAMDGIDKDMYNILLSHTPETWHKDIAGKKLPIDLTLSGHTHAMQFKINLFGKRYSPSSNIFREWSGLYKENDNYLYVNDGAGCVGVPVRIGTLPEVTVFEFVDNN